jgi:hypothetical protein
LALAHCDLFYLDKEDFEKHFSKCISKAETDRKDFFANTFPFLASNFKLDEHYQKIVPLFLKTGDVIYFEGAKADALYLIYAGECALRKNFKKNIMYDYFSVKNMKTILHLTSGQVAGVESLFKGTFDHTLIAESEYTIVFKIVLTDFLEYRILFKNLYESLYKERKLLIEKFVKNHIAISKKMKIHYRSRSENILSPGSEVVNKKKEIEQRQELENLIERVKGNGPVGQANEIKMENIKFALPQSQSSHRLELPQSTSRCDYSKSFIRVPISSNNASMTTGLGTLKSSTIETNKKTLERKVTYSKSFVNISDFNKTCGTMMTITKKPTMRINKKFFEPIRQESKLFTLNTGTFDLPMVSMFKK